MKKLLFLLSCFISLTALSQTKMIAFKSHSGSAENFSTALDQDLFDMDEADFGLPPKVLLDSVIYVKKSVAVVVTRRGEGDAAPVKQRDTVHSKTLFTKKVPLDSLRRKIRTVIRFDNSPDSIKFIGFDKSAAMKKQSGGMPVISFTDNRYNPFDGMALAVTGLIVLASVLAGWAAWRLKHKTFQPA
jgi:hypothetical protein